MVRRLSPLRVVNPQVQVSALNIDQITVITVTRCLRQTWDYYNVLYFLLFSSVDTQ